MTRVDFYVLQSNLLNDRLGFVCRLVDKAMRNGNRILINAADEATAQALDELLWSFRPESFIPHGRAGEEDTAEMPVAISVNTDQPDHHDLLVNLGADLPPFFSRFRRLAEVVIQAEEVLRATRQHYAFLKQRGYPVKTHQLPS